MGANSLLSSLSEGENQQQEFKFCVTDSRKLAETISAFSNAIGGKIFIGVKDNGKLKGIDPEEEGFMVDAAASMYCLPKVECIYKVWETSEGKILEVGVPEATVKPVLAKTENDSLKPFVRINDANHLAPWILTECWKMQQSNQAVEFRHNARSEKIFAALNETDSLSQRQLEKKTRIPRPVLIRLMAKLLCWDLIELSWGQSGPVYSINRRNQSDNSTSLQ
jgi:predicted HTH transcriptional regulator